jgi:hypothetical protein
MRCGHKSNPFNKLFFKFADGEEDHEGGHGGA